MTKFVKLDPVRESAYQSFILLVLPEYQNVSSRLQIRSDLKKLSIATCRTLKRIHDEKFATDHVRS